MPVTRPTPQQPSGQDESDNTNTATPSTSSTVTSSTTQSTVNDTSSNNEVKDMLTLLMRRMDEDRENNNKNNSEVNDRIQQLLNQQHLLQQQQVTEPQSTPLSTSTSVLYMSTPRPAVPTTFSTGIRPSTAIPFSGTKRSLQSQLGGVGELSSASKETLRTESINSNINQRGSGGVEPRERSKAESELIKGTKPPEVFTGDEPSERIKVRQWILQINNWINLFIGKDRDGSTQELRMETIATRLSGGALIWYETERARAELEGRVLRWDEITPRFIERFEGQDNILLYEQELELLTYRRGKCKDLYKLETEFDRLRLLLYPNSEGNSDLDRILGNMYGQAILRGDRALHTKMLELGLPRSLLEWKTLAQRAVVLRQHTYYANNASNTPRPYSSSGGYNSGDRSSSQQPTVNNTTVTHNGGDEPEEGQEGQTDSRVSVQNTSANRPKLPRGWRDANNKHIAFTDTELSALSKNRRCFICYSKDHRGFCPNFDNRPRRKPNAEELKA
jgi:hypothetical protein